MSNLPPPPPPTSGDPEWTSAPQEPQYQGPQAATGWAQIGTGETVELAGAGSRLAARLIDVVIMAVTVIILLVIGVASVSDSSLDADGTTTDTEGLGGFLLVLAIAVCIVLLYEVTLTAMRGQTLGKMATRIMVIRADNGQVPGWGKSLVRWILPSVAGFVPFIGWAASLLIYLWLLWDPVKQGLHDKAASTLVIKV